MRFEDNMMPILTGLVFAVVVGTTAQNSGDLLKLFGSETEIQADDDVFFVRAGTDSTLDVLANDVSDDALSGYDIQIVSAPSCGTVSPSTNGITYLNSESCEGPISFSYCLGEGDACEAADVTMNVRPAPVSVAKTHLPKQGDLVPLNLSPSYRTAVKTETSLGADEPVKLNAFVVTMLPPKAEVFSNVMAINKFMISADVSDLHKMPSSDPSQFASLHSLDVPLSAALSARFLTNHSATSALIPGGSLVEKSAIVDETAKVELAPDNTQG